MVLLLILIIASLLLLKLFKLKISVLGLKPNSSRIKDFGAGFTGAAGIAIFYFLLLVISLNYNLHLNKDYNWLRFLDATWWTFKSVLIEELLFRGVLLVVAINFMGKNWACIFSSVIFGIYHWFSYQVFGTPIQMLHTFVITGIGGLMFAYAFAETRSMYLPIGLHFGWNLVSVVVFSEGPLGNQFIISTGGEPMGHLYFVFLLYQVLVLPALTYLYLKVKKKKSKESKNYLMHTNSNLNLPN